MLTKNTKSVIKSCGLPFNYKPAFSAVTKQVLSVLLIKSSPVLSPIIGNGSETRKPSVQLMNRNKARSPNTPPILLGFALRKANVRVLVH